VFCAAIKQFWKIRTTEILPVTNRFCEAEGSRNRRLANEKMIEFSTSALHRKRFEFRLNKPGWSGEDGPNGVTHVA